MSSAPPPVPSTPGLPAQHRGRPLRALPGGLCSQWVRGPDGPLCQLPLPPRRAFQQVSWASRSRVPPKGGWWPRSLAAQCGRSPSPTRLGQHCPLEAGTAEVGFLGGGPWWVYRCNKTISAHTASRWAASCEVAAHSVSANPAMRAPPASGELAGRGGGGCGGRARESACVWVGVRAGGRAGGGRRDTGRSPCHRPQVRAGLLREPHGAGQLMPAVRLQWQR